MDKFNKRISASYSVSSILDSCLVDFMDLDIYVMLFAELVQSFCALLLNKHPTSDLIQYLLRDYCLLQSPDEAAVVQLRSLLVANKQIVKYLEASQVS